MDIHEQSIRLASALLVGALVGIERGWSLRDQKAGTRVAGVRTFSLLGLLGGLAGLLATTGQKFVGGTIIAATVAILVVAYARQLRAKRDATTAVTSILIVAVGFIAGSGTVGIALALAAAIVLILALRIRAHRFVERLSEADVTAFARFAVIALGVFPFLPDRAIGPYDAWNPTRLWWVVVIVTGLSFAGYIANRAFGVRYGTVATAVIGGAYSSTAVTQSLAQRIAANAGDCAAAAGIALASAVMYLRVIVLVAIIANRLFVPFVTLILPALAVQALGGLWLYRKAEVEDRAVPSRNPIALLPALGFVAFIALAAVAAQWTQIRYGGEGVVVLLFVMGIMDVDASIVTAGGLSASVISAELAALAIGGTVVANMALKIGVTLVYARSGGRAAAVTLLASTLVLAATLALSWLSMS
ncbi:MAG: DUF4010 domain-containing protein [Novosphingobium sp.]|nr:DUF4010 domain-containing protein [Novosphingobium sp.]